MAKDLYIGIGIEILGNGAGVRLQMTGIIEPVVGWGIVGASSVISALFIYHGIKSDKQVIVEPVRQIEARDYTEEWGHFDKLNDALIKLQSAPLEEARALADVIQRERVYLDDSQLQSILTDCMAMIEECIRLGMTVDALAVDIIISGLAARMNKRYKRTWLK